MSEPCEVLECGCEQGVFSNIVSGVVEVRDYLTDDTGVEFAVENPSESGFQLVDGEFLELN